MGTELTRTTSTKKKKPIVRLDLDDREVHGHGQQLLARAGQPYLKMSYSTFGYGGAYASSGAQVGLSSSPISHYTASCPTMPYLYFVSYQPSSPHLGGY